MRHSFDFTELSKGKERELRGGKKKKAADQIAVSRQKIQGKKGGGGKGKEGSSKRHQEDMGPGRNAARVTEKPVNHAKKETEAGGRVGEREFQKRGEESYHLPGEHCSIRREKLDQLSRGSSVLADGKGSEKAIHRKKP